ncbi:MAG: hypothetical protein WBV82_14905 [Myxococcaceae bacterium]
MRTQFVLVVLMLAVAQPTFAKSIAEEGFDHSFPVYANAGSGFAGPWKLGGFNALSAGYVLEHESLFHPGVRACRGGSISGFAFTAINGTVRDLARPLGATPTTFYVSFLLRPDGVLNEGAFNGFFGLTLNGSAGELFVGKSGGGTIDEYILESRGGVGQVSSGVRAKVGKSALLVVKVELMAGPDLITLFANPNLRLPEPGSGAVKSDLDLGTVSKIGLYSTGAFRIDDIRIGTTWDDVVVPIVGGPRSPHASCATP